MSHEWIKEEGGIATIGLNKTITEEIGQIVFITLPEVTRKVEREEPIAILESTKAAIDLYSPISGIVIGVNEELLQRPGLLNEDPEGRGWLYKIQSN